MIWILSNKFQEFQSHFNQPDDIESDATIFLPTDRFVENCMLKGDFQNDRGGTSTEKEQHTPKDKAGKTLYGAV